METFILEKKEQLISWWRVSEKEKYISSHCEIFSCDFHLIACLFFHGSNRMNLIISSRLNFYIYEWNEMEATNSVVMANLNESKMFNSVLKLKNTNVI